MKLLFFGINIIIMMLLFCLSVYTPWYFLEPETFWQKFFCALVVELPVALFSSMLCVGFGIMFSEIIEKKIPS